MRWRGLWILMNPQTWVVSGIWGGFSDPLMDCKEVSRAFRADKLIEDFCRGEKRHLLARVRVMHGARNR